MEAMVDYFLFCDTDSGKKIVSVTNGDPVVGL